MKIFGREPAVILAFAAALIAFVSTWVFTFTPEQQALMNGVLVAVAGLVTAWRVSAEKALPFILGLAQAVIALLLGFKVHMDPDQQATIMSVLATLLGIFVRTQVVAPVAPPLVQIQPAPANPGVVIQRQGGGGLT